MRGEIKRKMLKERKKTPTRIWRGTAVKEGLLKLPDSKVTKRNCIGRRCEVGIATESNAMQSAQPLHGQMQY